MQPGGLSRIRTIKHSNGRTDILAGSIICQPQSSRRHILFGPIELCLPPMHFQVNRPDWLACGMTLDIHWGQFANRLSGAVAQMVFVKLSQEMCDDDVHLQLGKPHAQAGMPCQTPACIAIVYFLVLGALRKVARRIPLLRITEYGRVLVGIGEMICLARTSH